MPKCTGIFRSSSGGSGVQPGLRIVSLEAFYDSPECHDSVLTPPLPFQDSGHGDSMGGLLVTSQAFLRAQTSQLFPAMTSCQTLAPHWSLSCSQHSGVLFPLCFLSFLRTSNVSLYLPQQLSILNNCTLHESRFLPSFLWNEVTDWERERVCT